IEQLDEARLKLDAVAWSEDPKRRIAVINGHIMREGQSIDGFVIDRIGAEEVVVREGGLLWRLVFRIH
ncbi:general secretion pathway protein GspB, partial [Thermodesulfobacteriota bacterium]